MCIRDRLDCKLGLAPRGHKKLTFFFTGVRPLSYRGRPKTEAKNKMRNVIFAVLAVFSVAGCGDNNTTPPTPIKDLSVKASPDLTQPLNGCNGLLNCYVDCNTSNPVQSCFDDCDAGATQEALNLLN